MTLAPRRLGNCCRSADQGGVGEDRVARWDRTCPAANCTVRSRLLLQFSVLEIDPDDEQEQFLVEAVNRFAKRSLCPGRAVDRTGVRTRSGLGSDSGVDLNEKLIEDLTVFLSGPCSCQVKDRNPGFDLLLSADWESRIVRQRRRAAPRRVSHRARQQTKTTHHPSWTKTIDQADEQNLSRHDWLGRRGCRDDLCVGKIGLFTIQPV